MTKSKISLTSWGNYPASPAYLIRPERYQELFPKADSLIARGLGRSYGDAALNADRTVLLMERFNRFLSFDEKKGLLRAEAGVSLAEILEVFAPRGWFLPVTPGTKYVTLGGAFAADIHGKNHHVDGTFGQHVHEIELILANGTSKRCSPNENANLFWASAGGMGLTGIIAEMTLQLIPIQSAYIAVHQEAAKNLDHALALLEDKGCDDKYSVAWIDCLATGPEFGRSIVMNGHHASLEELSNLKIKNPLQMPSPKQHSIPCFVPSWILNPWSIQVFNSLYYKTQSHKKASFITDCQSYFYPLDAIGNWNRLYGKRGFIQYQFVVPKRNSREGLQKILHELTQSRKASFLAVLKRFGPENQGMLSFPREGFTLALDIPLGDPNLFDFLDRLDELVLKYEGRVYLAKDARLKPAAFRAMYPRYPQWQRIKSQIDPQDRFSSDLSRRLQLGGNHD